MLRTVHKKHEKLSARS